MKKQVKFVRIANIIFVITLILLSFTLQAQDNLIFKGKRHKIGFMAGFGGQSLDQLINELSESNQAKIREWLEIKGINPEDIGTHVPYDFRVKFFQLQYYYSISSKKTTSTELLFQPQYNITEYQPVKAEPGELMETVDGYEAGISCSLLFRKNILSDYISLYFGIGAGPFWVSGTPIVQADGFIFTLTGFAGINLKLIDNLYLDFRPGYTHISNAGIKYPNRGLNDVVISGGFYLTY